MARIGRMVKEASVTELSSRLSERPNFFVTTINRLSATEADQLRQKLFASQARLIMTKRRLGHRAAEALKIGGLSELLQGSVGFVLAGEDVLQAAKIIVEFRKSHEERLALRGALIDGQLLDTHRVEELAQLPPKPMLLADVVGVVESLLADVTWTLERLLGEVMWAAEQAAAQKPAEPAAQAPTPPAAEPPAEPQQPGGGPSDG